MLGGLGVCDPQVCLLSLRIAQQPVDGPGPVPYLLPQSILATLGAGSWLLLLLLLSARTTVFLSRTVGESDAEAAMFQQLTATEALDALETCTGAHYHLRGRGQGHGDSELVQGLPCDERLRLRAEGAACMGCESMSKCGRSSTPFTHLRSRCLNIAANTLGRSFEDRDEV